MKPSNVKLNSRLSPQRQVQLSEQYQRAKAERDFKRELVKQDKKREYKAVKKLIKRFW